MKEKCSIIRPETGLPCGKPASRRSGIGSNKVFACETCFEHAARPDSVYVKLLGRAYMERMWPKLEEEKAN